MLRWLADRFVYYNWGPAIPFPAARKADFEDVTIVAPDGIELHGRWYPCPNDLAAPLGRPRPTVLFCHGNAGDVRRWYPVGGRWQDAIGANVLVFDYRGYGRSGGRSSADGLALDSRAAHEWLLERGVDPSRIVIVGQSLGGGVAVELATSGAAHAALVLESTFTSLPEVANGLLWNTLPLGRLVRDVYPSLERLAGYEKPVFLSHGERDRLIPIAHARRLIGAPKGPKKLFVTDFGHYDRRDEPYGIAVRDFLAEHLPRA